MATRTKAKQASKKTTVKSTNKAKQTIKKTVLKTAKKQPVKAAPKKVATKSAAKLAAKKPVAKLVTKPAAKPVAASTAPTRPAVLRKPFDRAQQKAPINTVAKPEAAKAPVNAIAKKAAFAVNDYVVYPTHGVGKILGFEVEKIGEYELKVFVIAFEKDKMTLRVPVGRAEAAGLRSISPTDQITRAITTLKGRAKIARGMWSRRAQEYEAKINSGNLIQIAEVVRDLHKNVDQSERSYSERMIYETAMHRLCGEVAASERVDIKDAQDRLLKVLRKQAAAA